jgi:hypothetical protein
MQSPYPPPAPPASTLSSALSIAASASRRAGTVMKGRPTTALSKLRPSRVLFPREFRKEPGPRHPPVALRSADGNAQHLCRLLDIQSAEVAQLHHSALATVDSGECFECLIQGENFNTACLRRQQHLIERHAQDISATLRETAAARMIHQGTPDDLRAQGQEMHPVLTANSPGAHQL